MDIALGIEALLPAAEYFGTTNANTKECFDDLNWQDKRKKPTWKQIQDAWVDLESKLDADYKEKIAKKQAILDKLGLTADEAQLLIS